MYKFRHFFKLFLLVNFALSSNVVIAINTHNDSKVEESIVVSSKPLFNIAAAILDGIGTPDLLLTGNASPHNYTLKPSDIYLINNANVVIWGGNNIEPFLTKIMYKNNIPSSRISRRTVIDISTNNKLLKLPLGDSHNTEHKHGHTEQHKHDHHFDPHVWLSTKNAVIIAEQIANIFMGLHKDPYKAKTITRNLEIFKERIKKLDQDVTTKLSSVADNSFLVFHDAYRYFEKQFNLNKAGAIHLNPQASLSVKKLKTLNNFIIQHNVKCIFSEPQFNVNAVKSLSKKLKIKQGMLDPLGDDKDLGIDGYFKLIRSISDNFYSCFSD